MSTERVSNEQISRVLSALGNAIAWLSWRSRLIVISTPFAFLFLNSLATQRIPLDADQGDTESFHVGTL